MAFPFELREFIVSKSPQIMEVMDECIKSNSAFIFHQDSFAAEYNEEEIRLLGCVIKYAGSLGVEVKIIGNNRETLK